MTKPPEGGFVAAGCAILQTGHILDGCQHFIVRAVSAGALRRHGVDALDCRRQQTVEAAFCVCTGLPGSGILILRRTQQANAMASVAVLGDDVATATRSATGSCSGDCTHALAFLARYADFTYRLQTLGNAIVGRSLSAHRPQGQYGGVGHQHLLSPVHLTPSSWLETPAATVRERATV